VVLRRNSRLLEEFMKRHAPPTTDAVELVVVKWTPDLRPWIAEVKV
jgi:hypothetical protein